MDLSLSFLLILSLRRLHSEVPGVICGHVNVFDAQYRHLSPEPSDIL